jgi:hypothetical protein
MVVISRSVICHRSAKMYSDLTQSILDRIESLYKDLNVVLAEQCCIKTKEIFLRWGEPDAFDLIDGTHRHEAELKKMDILMEQRQDQVDAFLNDIEQAIADLWRSVE